MIHNILIDCREFFPNKITGIGRVLIGLIEALSKSPMINNVNLAVVRDDVLPEKLSNFQNIGLKIIPKSFLASERSLSNLTRLDTNLFISPYPKLPLFGVACRSINIVHDVLYLSHLAYRKNFKAIVDKIRLARALKMADLTWYDSKHSLSETKNLVGRVGKNSKVRYPGLAQEFNFHQAAEDQEILKKYNLKPGYILLVGNGLPHKNLGVVLQTADKLTRKLVVVGVNQINQQYWKSLCPDKQAIWIEHVKDHELPSIFRSAFCLAQPSTAEGFGYPPLEAMACGVPAVVSHIPVLLETTGTNALSADPKNSDIWLSAFNALENEEFYQSHVANGLNWVKPFIGQSGWDHQISDIADLM